MVGGVATQEIEAWVLACAAEPRSETHTDPKRVCADLGHDSTAKKVSVIEGSSLQPGAIPPDAHSLLLWLSRARAVLGTAPAS